MTIIVYESFAVESKATVIKILCVINRFFLDVGNYTNNICGTRIVNIKLFFRYAANTRKLGDQSVFWRLVFKKRKNRKVIATE